MSTEQDWNKVEVQIAELVAATKTRSLNQQEARQLGAAVDMLLELEQELGKQRPSAQRLRTRMLATIAHFRDDEFDQNER